ncbi:MAG: sigma-70 family RNA polymerase sigma factor [Planctomycetes bacterium]|nr:sigma-70 family RNA polymerase sigma factor [Planctomycetota bacterium]
MPHRQQDLIKCAAKLGAHSVAVIRDKLNSSCIAEACDAHPDSAINAVLHACFYCTESVEVRHEFILYFADKVRPGLISKKYKGVISFMNTEDFRNELVAEMLSKLSDFEFRSEAETSSWMRRVIHNIALRILQRRFPLSGSVEDLQKGNTPDSEILRAEFLRNWHLCWGKLHPTERDLLAVAEQADIRLVDVADQFGYAGNVDLLYKKVSQARAKFKNLLEIS